MRIQELHAGWVVRAGQSASQVPSQIAGRDWPATVPGCVHTDLRAANLIADPYLDRNESLVQWIGQTDWVYRCGFEADPTWGDHQRVELVCEGLDTLGRVELNGRLVGESMDMHVPCAFDVAGALRAGPNELTITFASAQQFVERRERELGQWPHVGAHAFNHIRKMACNFGWDWGPTLITAGIWRPIYLRAFDTARIAAVRPLTKRATTRLAIVQAHVDVDRAGQGKRQELLASATLIEPGGRRFVQEATVKAGREGCRIDLRVPRPQLWWPVGYGDQPLYDLHVELRAADSGQVLDSRRTRTGIRQVRLDRSPDDIGSRFAIQVNGRDILCKGANWIPDDCLLTRVSRDRLARRIDQAVGANMNMLRVWGGGIFESEDFYDLCDQRGVLVWQDFLFACAAYPETDELVRLVEAEAHHHVARLGRHPSLVLYNGCNENLWGWFDWNWKAPLAGRPWGSRYYFELLPRIIAELDPSRPYWPGSPYSGSMDIHPLDERHGNAHVWDVWGSKDYLAYREHQPRFASEFGFQGPPTFATLHRAIPPDQWSPDSPAMLAHQKGGGNPRITKCITEHFRPPEGFDDWVYLAHVNQARAIRTAVEWWRSLGGRCMGMLYWQINDCWPVTSWAAVDGYGRPKPLWYATRRFFAPRLLTIQPDGPGLRLCACNDTPRRWRARGTVVRMDLGGAVLAEQPIELDVPPRSSRSQAVDPAVASADQPSRQMLAARAGSVPAATWFFAPDKELEYPAPDLSVSLRELPAAGAGGGDTTGSADCGAGLGDKPGLGDQPGLDGEPPRRYRLRLKARSLVRDLVIHADLLDEQAAVSDQLLTLLPGESAEVIITSRRPMERKALEAVTKCANRFGAAVARDK